MVIETLHHSDYCAAKRLFSAGTLPGGRREGLRQSVTGAQYLLADLCVFQKQRGNFGTLDGKFYEKILDKQVGMGYHI